jgi:hypothetical protein
MVSAGTKKLRTLLRHREYLGHSYQGPEQYPLQYAHFPRTGNPAVNI